MPYTVTLEWSDKANFRETIELDDDQIAVMKEEEVDLTDAQQVFDWLNENDELLDYEADSWDGPEFDTGKVTRRKG